MEGYKINYPPIFGGGGGGGGVQKVMHANVNIIPSYQLAVH